MTYNLNRLIPGFTLVEESPACPKCGQLGILAAWMPHGWDNANGAHLVEGKALVLLCNTCSRDDRDAAPLLTFFDVHGELTEESIDHFVPLVRAWLQRAQVQQVDSEDFEADVQAWQRGEFD
jgi:hypothetical protein